MDRDELNFAGKTVIVTGGNGGIGQGIVDVFSERDANVVIADRAPALVEVKSHGKGKVIDVRTDITDRTSVDAMIARTMKEFGRVDVLINNAGRGEGMAKLPDVTQAMVDWMVKLNIVGTFNVTQAVVAQMIPAGGGSIVNISSAAALSGIAGHRDPIYAGCKGFLNSFTKALAADLGASNIRVNTVSPGWVVPESSRATSEGSFWNTMALFGKPDDVNREYEKNKPQVWEQGGAPLKRLGRPRDIAYACLYFASDAARFSTGQILSIDGGGNMPS
jgi:2-hydroxycyclohexanecarboxyl-CoA dehydrogenase